MRTVVQLVILVAVVLASRIARADESGIYDVKYEQISTNCQSPLNYPHGKLAIVRKGNQVTVDIDRTPLMAGVPTKNGAVNAKSKSGKTMIEGMDGVFSVSGRVTPEGQLHLVMVGEYTANKKPLCSQSWNVTGPRDDTAKPKK